MVFRTLFFFLFPQHHQPLDSPKLDIIKLRREDLISLGICLQVTVTLKFRV